MILARNTFLFCVILSLGSAATSREDENIFDWDSRELRGAQRPTFEENNEIPRSIQKQGPSTTLWSQDYLIEEIGSLPGGKVVKITNTGIKKCLDNTASFGNGARIMLWDCNGTAAQMWIRIPSGNNLYFQLKSVGSDKCIDILGPSVDNGAKLHQWTCGSQYSQQWSENGDGHIIGRQSGKCIDIPGPTANTGVGLHLWSCL